MKTRHIIRGAAVLAAALALAGCQKEILPEETGHSGLKFEVTVGAKGDYDGGAETRAVKPGWQPNDRILVYFDGDPAKKLELTYDNGLGEWLQSETTFELEASGDAQALHGIHVYAFELDGEMVEARGDLLYTDTGSYTSDGETVWLTLDMTERVTSRITVEGLTEPLSWLLAGPGLNCEGAYGVFEGSFDQTLREMFRPSALFDNRIYGHRYEYHEEGSVSFFVLDAGTEDGTTFLLYNTSNEKYYTRTYSERELEPGKAVVIQGPEGDEADQWTDLTASVNTLQDLFDATEEYYSLDYPDEAYNEFHETIHPVLISVHDGSIFTEAQIDDACLTLRDAMEALEATALPPRLPVDIQIRGNNLIDGVLYVPAGEWFGVSMHAVDENGNSASNDEVTFTLTEPAWMEEVSCYDTHSLSGRISESASAGQTVTVTVESVEDPGLSRSFTIRVAGEDDLITLFVDKVDALPAPAAVTEADHDAMQAAWDIYNNYLDWEDREDARVVAALEKLGACFIESFLAAVDALPAPQAITQEHGELLEEAYELYLEIPWEIRNNSAQVVEALEKLGACFIEPFLAAVDALPAPQAITQEHGNLLEKADDLYSAIPWEIRMNNAQVAEASEKLEACQDVYYDLPDLWDYTFAGNTVTVVPRGDERSLTFTYAQIGAFPCGTYTTGWMDEDGDGVDIFQVRLVLNSDDTFAMEVRGADDLSGTNASAWEQEEHGTYTNSGTQAAGGTLTLTYEESYYGGGDGGGMQPDTPTPDNPKTRASAAAPSSPRRMFRPAGR